MKNKNTLFDEDLLIEIFIKADDVCKIITNELVKKMIEDKKTSTIPNKLTCQMSEIQIML